jgi:uncharacterized protein Veg
MEKERRGAGKLTCGLPRAEEQARDRLFARTSSRLAIKVENGRKRMKNVSTVFVSIFILQK